PASLDSPFAGVRRAVRRDAGHRHVSGHPCTVRVVSTGSVMGRAGPASLFNCEEQVSGGAWLALQPSASVPSCYSNLVAAVVLGDVQRLVGAFEQGCRLYLVAGFADASAEGDAEGMRAGMEIQG